MRAFHFLTAPAQPQAKWLAWLAVGIAGIAWCGPVQGAPPPGYYLVWADEFDGATLDSTRWNHWLPGPRRDAVNTPGAVSVSGGKLVITTYTSNGTHYTGMIATDSKFRTKFGYWEASIDWNDAPGMWSAYWMQSPTMGADITDPVTSGCEIDIAEHRLIDSGGNNIANKVQANIHWNGYGANHVSQGSGNVGTGLDSGFHTYGFKWTSGSYDFSIDGASKWTGGTSPVSRSTEYMILSSEVDDGSWAGSIPAGGYGNLGASTTKMAVDYVRYYAPTSMVFWTGSSSASWSDAGNWLSNRLPAASSDLVFSYLSKAGLSNVLDGSVVVDSLTVLETSGPFSANGAGSLTIGAGGVDMISMSRDAEFNCPVVISGAPAWTIGAGRKLTVNARLSGVGGSGIITKAGKGTLVIGASNVIHKSILATAGAIALNSGVSNQYSFRATGGGAVTALMGPGPARCASLDLTNASLNFSFGTVSNLFGPGLVVPALNLSGSNAVNITGLNLPLASITLLTYTTRAGAGQFYLGNLPPGSEATLSDTGSALVLNVTRWPQVLTWHGSASGTWNTNGVTLDWNGGAAPYQQYGPTADSVGFDDSAVDFSVTLSHPVSPAAVLVDNEAAAYTFNGPGRISGGTGFEKRGTNTLTLNTSNTFSGSLVIRDGKVVIGSGGGLYQKTGGTKVAITNGGTLSVSGNLGYDRGVFGYLAAQATGLLLDNGTVQHTGTGNARSSDGAGRLFTIGPGGATLDSATAGQTFYIGYRYDYSASLASSSGGSLELTGVGNGDLNYSFPGSGSLLKTGAGTWLLTVANTFTGPATVERGVLNVQSAGALGGTASGTTVLDGARLELQGGIVVSGEPLTLSGTGGTGIYTGALNSKAGSNAWTGPVTLGESNARIGAESGATLRVAGPIGDGGAHHNLVIRSAEAAGSVILSGASTYLGSTWLIAGNLKLDGGNNRLPAGTTLIVGGAGTPVLDLNGQSQALSGLTNSGSVACLITNSSAVPATLALNVPSESPSLYAGRLAGNLALVKSGPGELTFTATNTLSGSTLLQEGTLVVNGALGGSLISVGAGTALQGSGVLNAPATVHSNGVVDPGVAGPGRLTFNDALTLQPGAVVRMDLHRLDSTHDVVTVNGELSYGGALIVTNLAGTPAAGDSFPLFSATASTGNFDSMTLPPLPQGLGWEFAPADGTLNVVASYATDPVPISVEFESGSVTLSWPESHRGWILQSQTNPLSTGLGASWTDVPGSGSVFTTNLPMDMDSPAVFFRLRLP